MQLTDFNNIQLNESDALRTSMKGLGYPTHDMSKDSIGEQVKMFLQIAQLLNHNTVSDVLKHFDKIAYHANQTTGIKMTESKLNEVDWKKMAATVGLIGSMFTAGNVEAYDNRDLMKMGFNPSEANQIAQMIDSNPQQAADIINNTIGNMRQLGGKGSEVGARKVYGGDTYTFPTTDAATVGTTKPTNQGPLIGTRQDPQSTSYDGRRSAGPIIGTPGDSDMGTGDPAKIKKNALILRDVINSDRSMAKHFNKIYYSSTLNKIVIIPNYNDFGRQAGIKINSKLGQGIADNVARRMITPIITRAISKVGVPGLNMDNVIIVDRERRAPR
jgi:hypothetical protein